MSFKETLVLPTITILCPVYNESENVENFYTEISRVVNPLRARYNFKFLFVDNCSTDDTSGKVKKICDSDESVRLIMYSKNFGVMKSIYTGILNSSADACAVFDCDLQDPPELLLNFISCWESGAKVVYGVRRSRSESYLLSFFRKIYRYIETFLKGGEVKIESGAWFLDKRVVHELSKCKFESYLAGLISRVGFRSIGVPYDRRPRIRGTSKFGYMKYIAYATDGLISGTLVPLRLSILIGIIFSLLSFFSIIYFIIAKFFLAAPFASGIAAAIIIVLAGFGLNFMLLGIIGEYVGRIYLDRESSNLAIIDEVYPPLPAAFENLSIKPGDY